MRAKVLSTAVVVVFVLGLMGIGFSVESLEDWVGMVIARLYIGFGAILSALWTIKWFWRANATK